MREPWIYLSATFSLGFHFIFFALAIVLFASASKTKIDRPYIVSLVSEPSAKTSVEHGSNAEQQKESKPEPVTTPAKTPVRESTKKQTAIRDNANKDKAVDDRISEMMAKKRLERIVAMRNNIDLSSSAKTGPATSKRASGNRSAQGKDDYMSMVRARIMERWIYPETLDRNLEAVISIRIRRDGSVQILGLEKSSGSRLFDRSALSAISSIANLPVPPDGIDEIGIRFKP